jgi:hypothetical protein
MSSTSFRRPDLRLHLGYPLVTLTGNDATVPLATAIPDAPGFPADLRRLARAVTRTRARLTVVLPESEVWRGQLALPRSPLGRRRAAWAAAAAALAARPGEVAVVIGPRCDHLTPVAAVRRATLAEARRMLSSAGVRPDAIEAAGVFPGFAAAPRLAVRRRPAWQLPRAVALAATAGIVALFGSAAFVLWPSRPDVPPLPVAAQPAAPEQTTAPTAQAVPLRKRPESLALLRAESPQPRPKVGSPQVVATLATRNVPLVIVERRDGMPAELRLAELTTARARMADATTGGPLDRPALAPPTPDAAAAVPRHRPRTGPIETSASVPTPAAGGKPRPRPVAPTPTAPVQVAALQPSETPILVDARSGLPPSRPAAPNRAAPERARPGPQTTVVPEAATAKPGAATSLAAAVTALPPSRPPATQPKPKPVVARVAPSAPKAAVRHAPVRPRDAVAPAQVRRVQTPASAVVRASPAPPKVGVRKTPVQPKVAAAPAQVVRRAPSAAAPARTVASHTAKPARSLAASFASAGNRRTTRGNVTLIGVFGGASERHALLRLPNGNVARVRAGDSVRGAQVAAVGADTVRLRGGGRETVLTLPD